MRQRGFPEPGRAVKQDVLQGFAALFGGANLDLQVLFHLFLTNQLPQARRTQGDISRVIRLSAPREYAVIIFRAHCRNYTRFLLSKLPGQAALAPDGRCLRWMRVRQG